MIYLDNAATTFPKPESVYAAIDECMRTYSANPGRSGHQLALRAGRAIYHTRELICKLFGISNPMQIVFTSNATDSLNLAIKGLLKPGDHVITTSMEHNSVIRPIVALEKIGVEHTVVQCNEEGILDIDDLEKAILDHTKLIVTTHASNVTGTLMPIQAIGEIAKKHGVYYLVDAAQSAGVYDIDVSKMNIDLLAAPGHKGLLGPQGTGFLYMRDGLILQQMKEGGTGSKSELLTQPELIPDRYESGTANTPGIVGLGAGIEYLLKIGIENIRHHEEALTEYMLSEFQKIKGVHIYGPKDVKKQAAVVSINIDGADSSELSYLLDKHFGIAVRSGLHCAPLAHTTIGTLQQGTVRFSLGYFNKQKDVKRAVCAVSKIIKNIENMI